MPYPRKPADYASLLEFATTDLQRSHIEALIEHGTERKAAAALGRARNAIRTTINTLRKRAAMAGRDPFYVSDPNHDPRAGVPRPQYVKGVSQLRDETGAVKLEWLKTDTRSEQFHQMCEEIAKGISSSIEGGAQSVAPKDPPSATGLMNFYPIGDPHFGMYAWRREVGQDYDIDIAAERHSEALADLMERSPDAEEGVLWIAGDTFHCDDDRGRTYSGNPLDTDGRFSKVFYMTSAAMVRMIDRMRAKYPRVIVVVMIGNHDPKSAVVLAAHLQAWYRDVENVVIPDAQMFWYYRFGRTFLAGHHGHGPKPSEMPLIMAHDAPQDWARSTHRYAHIGHVHHSSKDKEHGGVPVESHRNLAPNDAWHHMKGYRGKCGMQCITYKKTGGEKGRQIFTVD